MVLLWSLCFDLLSRSFFFCFKAACCVLMKCDWTLTRVCVPRPTVSEMSDDEMRDKGLASARATLSGKTDLERASVLHQHLGSRVMTDMVIETFQSNAGLNPSGSSRVKAAVIWPVKTYLRLFVIEFEGAVEGHTDDGNRDAKDQTDVDTTPDSPSKQLPDQISFFSGNTSVEIVHGIMHLYKTKSVSVSSVL